ncbi:Yip1 family protein [Maribellus maritimus]|uniref:Yip1 family protein n=1 Tax=Maribellus maritimus TaxID=2870838 RepID=UPI001EEC48F3|nr:Yip1 family protein [Maribellus maritimus]MCG6188410.1 YIP1 family protein [Maribellus maritimus]
MEANNKKKIVTTLKENILNPKDFWMTQKESTETHAQRITGFFLPLLGLAAVAVFLGEFFRSSHFYMGYAVLKAMREIVLFVLQYLLAVYFTNELIKTFKGEKNIEVVRKLVLFSMTPFLVVSILTGLFQFLYVLDILGIYSFYIFWLGANELLELPKEKKDSYIIITILVNFFVFSFLSIILSKLLTAYF